MNILALDLSLTRTGVAHALGTEIIECPKHKGVERLLRIRNSVLKLATDAELVVIEGYAYGSARGASQQHSLGELGGVVKLALFEAGTPYVDVPPASLKKYATGKGNAKKEAVLTAAVRRLGYMGDDHNEADAAFLRCMALDAYGLPCVAMPQNHRASLLGVRWPTINGRTPCLDGLKAQRNASGRRSKKQTAMVAGSSPARRSNAAGTG